VRKVEKRLIYVIAGLVLIGISFYLMYSSGFSLQTKPFAIYKSGGRGISIKLERMTPLSLAVVKPGEAYKWKLTLRNEGSMTWESSWVTVRVGIKGATVTRGTEEGVEGDVLWEYCSQYPKDPSSPWNPNCRVDISTSGWNLQVSYDGGMTWRTPPCNQKVCSIDFGKIAPGSQKVVWISFNIPQTAEEGSYPLICNAVAYNSNWEPNMAIEATATDTIMISTKTAPEVYKGVLTIEFLGSLMMSIVGLALVLRGLI